jgi:hypothetical protein
MTDKPGGSPPKPGAAPPALAAGVRPAPAAAPMPPEFPGAALAPRKAAPATPPFEPRERAAPELPAFETRPQAAPVPPDFLHATTLDEYQTVAAVIEPPAFMAAPEAPSFDEQLTLAKRTRTYANTTWQTFVSSIVLPTAIGAGIAVAAFLVLGGIFAGGDLLAAATTWSLAPLLQGLAWQMLAIASAAGALAVSVWSLKDYLLAGRRYLLERLTKNIPKDDATLRETPAPYVRFYHGVLQWCGAFAFLCEIVFQLVAFAIITWGIAVGFPGLGLFNNPDQLSLANTFLFWVEDAFAIVDGPETLGLTLSPLDPNKAVWAFGLALIFFKIGVVGLVLQLVRTSFTLRPGDISLAWQRAYERQDVPPRSAWI